MSNDYLMRRHWLRQQLKTCALMLPGVYNGMTARQAEKAGFKSLYISGAALSAAAGLPDVGLLTRSEFVSFARYIVQATSLPCICDADTGFGEGVHVARTVSEYEAIGLSGLQIEDQVFPKRCGHLAGKSLASADDMIEKIRVAVEVRRDANFLIVARTDAFSIEGRDGVVSRAQAYLEAGADVIFPEALKTASDFQAVASQIQAPLMANMTEFGVSPLLSFSELQSMGYRLVIYPVTALRLGAKSAEKGYETLFAAGSQQGLLDDMQTRDELYALLDYKAYLDLDGGSGHA